MAKKERINVHVGDKYQNSIPTTAQTPPPPKVKPNK